MLSESLHSELNRIDILCQWDSNLNDDTFAFSDPEVGKYNPIKEVNLLERLLPRK
jgi:hypothetical protein